MRLAISVQFVLLALASTILGQSSDETILGVVVVSRHGDRTWKGAPPAVKAPATSLTTIGQHQMHRSGEHFRRKYIEEDAPRKIRGIDQYHFNPSAVHARTPDQVLLATSGVVFLQGLYPPASRPIGALSILSNGTELEGPMDGYQYAIMHTIPESDQGTIWLKGDDRCTKRDELIEAQASTNQYLKDMDSKTRSFYNRFANVFEGVLDKDDLRFENAYEIFDYINVGMVHNSEIAGAVSEEELHQLRTLADAREFQRNGDFARSSDLKAMPGRTLSRLILDQLESNVASKGANNKFNLLMASYDAFLSFFALSGLSDVSNQKDWWNFRGLPGYAGTMTFELFTASPVGKGEYPTEDDLQVRFVFRNGSSAAVESEIPVFGAMNVPQSYADFKKAVNEAAIKDVDEWCSLCGSDALFCRQTERTASSKPKISPTLAGVMGALITLAVVCPISVAFVLFAAKSRKRKDEEKDRVTTEKLSRLDSAAS